MNIINASACFYQHLPSRGMNPANSPTSQTHPSFPGTETRLPKLGAGKTNGPSPVLLREYRPASITPLWRPAPLLRRRHAGPAIRHGNDRRLQQFLLAAMARKGKLSVRRTVCCETSGSSMSGSGNGNGRVHRFGDSDQDSNRSLRELLREFDNTSRQAAV